MRDFEVEHTKRMHLIVARRDMAGFRHLHPKLGAGGTWSTLLTLKEAGSYRVFADFKRDGRSETLASDLAVDGPTQWQTLPAPATSAATASGYTVTLSKAATSAGQEAELGFIVSRGGKKVEVEDYLGAKGHLVALREGDMAYLHVHPTEPKAPENAAGEETGHGGGSAGARAPIAFATEFPSAGRYRLFLQFKEGGRVHTAAFTEQVAR